MKLANIILVHKDPLQVRRLAERLANSHSHTFIHVDLKCDIKDFLILEDLPNVTIIKNRINVNWGGFSIVEATIQLLKAVSASAIEFDYVNLLSGQGYPIKPTADFINFLTHNPDKCFLKYNMPGDPWLIEAEAKISSVFFTDHKFKGKFLVEKILKFMLPKRIVPKDYIIVGRSAWFTIDMESVEFILKTINEQAPIVNFFKWCWGSDEMFFHTLIYNSDLRYKLVNNNYRYIDWSDGNARPKILTMEDIPALNATDAFFARKFEQDSEVLSYIDKNLLKIDTAL